MIESTGGQIQRIKESTLVAILKDASKAIRDACQEEDGSFCIPGSLRLQQLHELNEVLLAIENSCIPTSEGAAFPQSPTDPDVQKPPLGEGDIVWEGEATVCYPRHESERENWAYLRSFPAPDNVWDKVLEGTGRRYQVTICTLPPLTPSRESTPAGPGENAQEAAQGAVGQEGGE